VIFFQCDVSVWISVITPNVDEMFWRGVVSCFVGRVGICVLL